MLKTCFKHKGFIGFFDTKVRVQARMGTSMREIIWFDIVGPENMHVILIFK